jgi:cytochrome P450
MAPEDRETYRPLLAGAFSPQVVKERADEVDELIGRVVPRLGDGPPRPALRRLALQVTTRLLVGLPDGDPDEAGVLRALGGLPAGRAPLVRRRRAERRLEGAVDVLRRRCAPGDVSFVGTLLAERPDALADETLARNLVYAVRTGGTDLGSFLHWLLWELAHAPDWLARGGGEREAEAIVLETLRLHQSEYLYRRAERPVRAEGLNVRRGTLLRVCVAESHRDAEWFPDPERWDPARFLAARPPRERYLPFGAPGTSCLGAGVAVAVARAFVAGLSRYRVGATEDGPPEHDGWHWHPSLRFRVSVAPA